MNTGNVLKKRITSVFEDVMSEHPEVTRDMLDCNGEIYYYNGNDGTDFDWEVNDRLCEFYTFYKETEMGCIKLLVESDDTITGYFYPDNGKGQAEKIYQRLNDGDAEYLKDLLLREADNKNIWDRPIAEIDFSA